MNFQHILSYLKSCVHDSGGLVIPAADPVKKKHELYISHEVTMFGNT